MGRGPFVVAGGARVHRHTGIDLAPEAVVLLRETLVLGRSGESGGRLRSVPRADVDHRSLFVEDLALDEAALAPTWDRWRAALATIDRSRFATAT